MEPTEITGPSAEQATQAVHAVFATFYEALTSYAINNAGQGPEELEVLVIPDENGHSYLRERTLPSDPWGRPYLYSTTGSGFNFELSTLGADGVEGGTGPNADIVMDQDSF